MPRQWIKLFVCSLLILTVGGNWVLVQCVAWTSMLVRFSASAPFAEAIQQTFDGKHPCNLCVLAEKAKKSEEKKENSQTKTELVLLLELNPVEVPQSKSLLPLTSFLLTCSERHESPPSPPPRSSIASC